MTIYNLDFVKELVNAFNVSNYGSEVNTNFVVEGDNIVVKFNCDQSSARKCLSQMARDLVREYYSDESVAGHFFDLKSFPFNFDKGRWTFNKAGTQFTVPICSGVIFNLKVHFAEEFRSEVRHQMIREVGGNSQHIKEILNKNIQQVAMDTSPHYIKCLWFNDPGIQAHFMKVLLAKMQKYSFNLLDFCRIDGNKVYFTDVENIDFVRSVTEVAKKRSGYHFRFPSSDDLKVRKYKGAMGELIFSLTGIPVYGYYRDNFIDKDRISNGDHFAFIPITKEGNNLRYLTRMEANKINAKFSHDILTNIRGQTEATRSNVFGDVYALSDGQIALLIPVIIGNSVINKDGQIEIDPGLRFRALSPAQSPLNSPTHAGPSGLRTPPNKRKADTDSGYDSNSPPKPKDSVAPSTSGDPRSLVEQPQAQVRSPTERSQDVTLKESPRQGLVGKIPEFPVLRENPLDVPGTSGVSGPSSSSQSLSAAQNVPAAWTQNPWSSPPPAHENKWTSSLPFTKQGPIDLSCKGAQAGANISKKEKELIEALLYTLNLMNYTLDGVYTNFFAKDGKIVSLLHDTVDREEYLQEVRDYIIEEYCEDEEEARELYDLDEFPFKLNYEEKQGKTVVANISSGALSNLKILFSQKFGKNVDAIDISAVKKVEKREKNEWVDRQLSNGDSLEEACEGCFPDEEPMKIIPVAFEGGEYVLDRSRAKCEVELLFREQSRRFRGTLVNEEEKNLFKELLYWFNSNNYALDPPHMNFIVKNGKIASLINDSVNVKEYLQEVINKTKKEYVNEKEAYDFNEFPFKFLSNCEKNQETTVVANISRGALLNLKELFNQGHEGKVEIKDIDINIVKKAVKSKKDELVNDHVRDHGLSPKAAIKSCYPDESLLECISIIKGEGGYWIDRDYKSSEVKSFKRERWPAKGKSKAEKMKSEDNKDSGYSSGFVTDAENVSSKAEATTSGYESMDCENTGKKSPKRKPEEPLEGSPEKSLRRDSSPCSRLESLSLSNSSHQTGKY